MTIYICGDSTAATYPPENAPITGWVSCSATTCRT